MRYKRKQIIIVGDRVLIQPDTGEKKSAAGLYLPPSVMKNRTYTEASLLKWALVSPWVTQTIVPRSLGKQTVMEISGIFPHRQKLVIMHYS
tara:strand:+ start:533 stop:805 length:273 start_codon:yes stop_codon:yes gene_type:complete